jgi:purine nucleoside permease
LRHDQNIELDVLVLPAFSVDDFSAQSSNPLDEFHLWMERYDFTNECGVPGANKPLYYTDDGIGITTTGMGKVEAATTVTALLSDPRLDLSQTYFLTAGIAGTTPEVGTLGSVFISDYIVDRDRKYRWPETHIDDHPIDLLTYRPRDYMYELDEELVSEAYQLTKDVELLDSEQAQEHRTSYPQKSAQSKPTVATGTNVCSDEFWHGQAFSSQAQWLTEQYGGSRYCITEMEDFGTATALDRFGKLDRYLSVRSVVNFDQPHENQTIRDSLDEDTGDVTMELGLTNAYRVGSRIVDHALGEWNSA